MRWLVDVAYLFAGLVYLPAALYHALFLGKNRSGWRERFGGVPCFDPGRRRIWIHAVSLGEINATPKLVSELLTRLPGYDIVFSTTTDTGYARAVELYGPESVFRFPLDFSFVIRRALDRIRPSAIVLVELEVWYNLIHEAHRRKVPVMVVNGRLTERSARRLARLGRLARSMFEKLRWVGAQDETIAARFKSLGVYEYRVKVTGSVKWDTTTIVDDVPGAADLARDIGLVPGRPVWVCGSTGPEEEGMILDAYEGLIEQTSKRPNVQTSKPASMLTTAGDSGASDAPVLILVPRKPERFDEVAALIRQRGYACLRRSHPSPREHHPGDGKPAVILGDTMGELRKFYSLAGVVFVGRSLVPLGGSDPMEVAALGKPILSGPHMDNFLAPVEALRAADALRIVRGADELARAVSELLADAEAARRAGERGREVVRRNLGATARTVDKLVSIIDPM